MLDNEGIPVLERLIRNKDNRRKEIKTKYRYGARKNRDLMDILEGLVDTRFIGVKEVKERVISEGFLPNCCNRCGFNHERIVDHKVPLIMCFVDGNKRNWRLENLELLCYNCYFLYIGDVFEQKQLEALEDYTSTHVRHVPQLDLPDSIVDKVEQEILKLGDTTVETDAHGRLENRPMDYGDDLISFVNMKMANRQSRMRS